MHQHASLSLDNFWWRVGQGSHIQQAPHPPAKHVWGEALILDSLSVQVGAQITKECLEFCFHLYFIYIENTFTPSVHLYSYTVTSFPQLPFRYVLVFFHFFPFCFTLFLCTVMCFLSQKQDKAIISDQAVSVHVCMHGCYCLLNFIPQGSFNRPRVESSSQSPSLAVDSRLKGLQVELSETCALCLSRLLSFICVPTDMEPELPDLGPVSPHGDGAVQLAPASPVHLLFKLDCCLDDVNVFTLSNLAGK